MWSLFKSLCKTIRNGRKRRKEKDFDDWWHAFDRRCRASLEMKSLIIANRFSILLQLISNWNAVPGDMMFFLSSEYRSVCRVLRTTLYMHQLSFISSLLGGKERKYLLSQTYRAWLIVVCTVQGQSMEFFLGVRKAQVGQSNEAGPLTCGWRQTTSAWPIHHANPPTNCAHSDWHAPLFGQAVQRRAGHSFRPQQKEMKKKLSKT